MKKPLLILFTCLICLGTSFGQGVQFGAKGSINTTWLLNNHVSDAAAAEQTYVASFGQFYGVSGAIFFNQKLGVQMDFLYDIHRQKYSNDGETFESETKLNRVSIPLMLKLRSETGAFIEIGAIYQALTSAQFTTNDSSFANIPDLRKDMAKTTIDAMFGVGVDIQMVAGLSLTTALRFWGSMSDLRGVDSFGRDLSDQDVLDAEYDGTYQQTRAVAAGFVIGLTYSLGKIAGD